MKVGLEIIEWFAGENGKQTLVEALKLCGSKYQDDCRVLVIGKNTISVNLRFPYKQPFPLNCTMCHYFGADRVEVQKRGEALYVDGQNIETYNVHKDPNDSKPLHPNILDALIEYDHLIPEKWVADSYHTQRFFFFRGVGFGQANDRTEGVRFLHIYNGKIGDSLLFVRMKA